MPAEPILCLRLSTCSLPGRKMAAQLLHSFFGRANRHRPVAALSQQRPEVGLTIVGPYTLHARIHTHKVPITVSVSLFGGLGVPADRSPPVFWNSGTVFIQQPQTVLSLRVSLLSSCAIPTGSLAQVRGIAGPVLVHFSKNELSRREMLPGCFPAPPHRFMPIDLHTGAFLIEERQINLSWRKSLVGGADKP